MDEMDKMDRMDKMDDKIQDTTSPSIVVFMHSRSLEEGVTPDEGYHEEGATEEEGAMDADVASDDIVQYHNL